MVDLLHFWKYKLLLKTVVFLISLKQISKLWPTRCADPSVRLVFRSHTNEMGKISEFVYKKGEKICSFVVFIYKGLDFHLILLRQSL